MTIDISDFLNSSDKILNLKNYGLKKIIIKGKENLFLLDIKCPHQGLPLTRSTVGGDTVICQWHGCRFSLVPDDSFPSANILKTSVIDEKEGKVVLSEI